MDLNLYNLCTTRSCKLQQNKSTHKISFIFYFQFFFLLQKTEWRYKYEILHPLGFLWIKAGQLLSPQKKEGYEKIRTSVVFCSILTLWEESTHLVKIEWSYMMKAKITGISQWQGTILLGFQVCYLIRNLSSVKTIKLKSKVWNLQ